MSSISAYLGTGGVNANQRVQVSLGGFHLQRNAHKLGHLAGVGAHIVEAKQLFLFGLFE